MRSACLETSLNLTQHVFRQKTQEVLNDKKAASSAPAPLVKQPFGSKRKHSASNYDEAGEAKVDGLCKEKECVHAGVMAHLVHMHM